MGPYKPCGLPTSYSGQRQTEMLLSCGLFCLQNELTKQNIEVTDFMWFSTSCISIIVDIGYTGVKVGEVLDQWTVLKSRLYQHPSVLQNIPRPEVSRQLGQVCPDILHVIDLILCIPASTADCEWGFSAMNLVKSDWWASLISDLVRPVDCTAVLCFHHWLWSSPRHQVVTCWNPPVSNASFYGPERKAEKRCLWWWRLWWHSLEFHLIFFLMYVGTFTF